MVKVAVVVMMLLLLLLLLLLLVVVVVVLVMARQVDGSVTERDQLHHRPTVALYTKCTVLEGSSCACTLYSHTDAPMRIRRNMYLKYSAESFGADRLIRGYISKAYEPHFRSLTSGEERQGSCDYLTLTTSA